MNFFIGLLICLAGIAGIYYSDEMTKFGRIMWAENNLGGTRQFYVLFGFIIVVLGFMILFGLVDLSGDPSSIQYNQLN